MTTLRALARALNERCPQAQAFAVFILITAIMLMPALLLLLAR